MINLVSILVEPSSSHHHKTGHHPENSLNPNSQNPTPITSNDDQWLLWLLSITSLYDFNAQDMHRWEITDNKKAATNAA